VHWSWGDSTSWLIILGVPSEADVAGLISSEAVAALASQLVQIIGSVVALNDQRMLEGIREDAMDSMRHYFLLNCPAGGGHDKAR
ncbi:MAG TPA: hypothetical protein VFM42_04500, partial [Sphingomicrobium sp.]|nr:hypothetical protein [Sphingomicrobium sp.]